MPTISEFLGITIRMYFGDHPPPHFHVYYAEYEAKVSIDTLEIIEGRLPRRVRGLVVEWALEHRGELRDNWIRAEKREQLVAVHPLE